MVIKYTLSNLACFYWMHVCKKSQLLENHSQTMLQCSSVSKLKVSKNWNIYSSLSVDTCTSYHLQTDINPKEKLSTKGSGEKFWIIYSSNMPLSGLRVGYLRKKYGLDNSLSVKIDCHELLGRCSSVAILIPIYYMWNSNFFHFLTDVIKWTSKILAGLTTFGLVKLII